MDKLNLRVGEYDLIVNGFDYLNEVNYYSSFNSKTRVLSFVFRGSTNKQDFVLDLASIAIPLNLTLVPLKTINDSDGAMVHAGFWARFVSERANTTRDLDKTIEYIRSHYGEEPISTVVVGHSLGAAWAFLQAADWATFGYKIDACYTYGQPLVGNEVTANALASAIGIDRFIRVVNRNDMIPHLGFGPNGSHPTKSDEYWVPYFGEDKKSFYIKKCNGGVDPTCSLSVKCLRWSWRHHSELENMSVRENFCRNNRVTPTLVYERNSV